MDTSNSSPRGGIVKVGHLKKGSYFKRRTVDGKTL